MFKYRIHRGLLASAVLPLVLLALGGVAEAQSDKSMPSKRPAAKAESPDARLRKEHNLPKGQARRQTKEQKLNGCKRNPGCRAKLDAATTNKPGRKPRPAATTDSPDEIERNKHKPPVPRSQKQSMNVPTLEKFGSFLSKLNPIQSAMAQGNYSVYLTPKDGYRAGEAYLWSYAISHGQTGSYYQLPSVSWGTHTCENRPCVQLSLNIPTTGDYIINFRAYRYNGGVGRLRHQGNGPIIENWDFTGAGCSTCNFATVEYLAAGWHHLYFYSPTSYLYFYSASVEPL